MEKRMTFVEGFGDTGQGDGFVAQSVDVVPNVPTMTYCAIVRFESLNLVDAEPSVKFILGRITEPGFISWFLGLNLLGSATLNGVWDNGGSINLFDFVPAEKPVGGKTIVVHGVRNEDGGVSDLYINGALADTDVLPAHVVVSAPFRLGASDAAVTVPFGAGVVSPSARNGIAGFSYAQVAMTSEEVAAHYRSIVQAEDITDDIITWTNLWSARRGLPDLEAAGGLDALWIDEISGAVLERTLINDQTPSMVVSARRVDLY